MVSSPKQLNQNSYQIVGTTLVKYIQKTTTNIAFIPHGVTKIAEKAFEGCDNLSKILIPETVIEIGHGAFNGCVKLQNINIPTSVKVIGEDAFDGCESLKRLYIPNSVNNFHLLGHISLNYLRMPMKLWNYGILMDSKIRNLVLGLPEDDFDSDSLFDLKIFNDMEDYPFVNFEPSVNLENMNVISREGCVVSLCEYETSSGREFYGSVITIPNSVLTCPSEMEVLDYHCVSVNRINPLYIPDTVEYIDDKAFELWGKPTLVTPKSNYQHLIGILGSQLNDVVVYII